MATEKVLGFAKENALILEKLKGMGISVPRLDGKKEFEEPICVYLEQKDLVPVVLRSEFNERVQALRLALAERDVNYRELEALRKTSISLEEHERIVNEEREKYYGVINEISNRVIAYRQRELKRNE